MEPLSLTIGENIQYTAVTSKEGSVTFDSTNEVTKEKKKSDETRKKSCWVKYIQEVKSRSLTLPTLLLAMYNIPIVMCLIFLQNILYRLVSPIDTETNCFTTDGTSNTGLVVAIVLQYLFLYMAYPLTGWLADTRLGRGRVVLLSIWLCWFGMLFQVSSFCIQYSLCGWPISVAKYGLSGIALILMTIGTAGFLANVFPYGIDLLVFESNVKVRSYIHWNVWAIFIGSVYNYGALVAVRSLQIPNLMMVSSILTFGLLSIAVILNTFLAKHFPLAKVKRNPYSTVYNVLMYAIKNKVPINRSAFTYSESKPPKRIDYGKEKYGGPFAHETVEDVKTFLRILTILVLLFGFFLAYPVVREFLPLIMNQFKNGATDLDGFGSYVLWVTFDTIPAGLLIPIFELVIIPLFPKVEFFLMKPLAGLLFNHILLLVSIFSFFGISTAGYLTSDDIVPCYRVWEVGNPTIKYSYFVLSATAALSGFADNFSFLYAFEFICSQAPTHMVGMLIGLFWCVRGTFIQLNFYMTLPLSYTDVSVGFLSCGFWATLISMLIGCVGLVCFSLGVRWYKRRERDDTEAINYQAALEDHFSRYLDQKEEFVKEQIANQKQEEYFVIESNSVI